MQGFKNILVVVDRKHNGQALINRAVGLARADQSRLSAITFTEKLTLEKPTPAGAEPDDLREPGNNILEKIPPEVSERIAPEAIFVADFNELAPTDTLDCAVELILSGSQQDFPVLDNGRVAGVPLRRDLIIALRQKDRTAPVSVVMQRDAQIVEPFEMLDVPFTHMKNCEWYTMPVMHQNQLVGLITMDNIGEFIATQDVLRSSSVGKPKPKGSTI